MENGDYSDWRHPTEDMEPEEVRDLFAVQKRFRFVLDRAIAHIIDADDPELAAWQVAFAMECPHCMGLTMTQKAAELGVGKAAISKGATAFCRIVELPPSKYMLSEDARDSYRELRQNQEQERKQEK